jgi:hypothetical protein
MLAGSGTGRRNTAAVTRLKRRPDLRAVQGLGGLLDPSGWDANNAQLISGVMQQLRLLGGESGGGARCFWNITRARDNERTLLARNCRGGGEKGTFY